MGKVFAIGDIHGRFDLLEKAIEEIEACSHTGGIVVFLGDYIDRGPQSREVIERLMAGPSDAERWHWICLQGNHEDMLLSCIDDAKMANNWWVPNGGAQTLMSYGAQNGDELSSALRRVPQQHISWLRSLPPLSYDDNRIYVHASVDETIDLENHTSKILQWDRFPDGHTGGYRGKHIVHGHTPHREVELHEGRTNLDTNAVFTGVLSVGVFDDDQPGGPVRVISVRV